MPRGRTSPAETELTPEEVAARRQERAAATLRRDRIKMLASAEAAVKRARQALVAGDDAEHATWLDVAVTSLSSYAKTARQNGDTPAQ